MVTYRASGVQSKLYCLSFEQAAFGRTNILVKFVLNNSEQISQNSPRHSIFLFLFYFSL